MQKPPGSLSLKRLGLGKILVKNPNTQTPRPKTPKIEEEKNTQNRKNTRNWRKNTPKNTQIWKKKIKKTHKIRNT